MQDQTDPRPAASADLNESARDRVDPRWRRFYDRLIAQRDELIDQAADLDASAKDMAPKTLQESPGEIATEEFQRSQLLATRSLDQEMLDEVNAALARITDGTYGVCELTGKPIPEERLEAVPWTRYTVEAQEQLEAEDGGGRVAMGARGERGPTAGLGSGHQGST